MWRTSRSQTGTAALYFGLILSHLVGESKYPVSAHLEVTSHVEHVLCSLTNKSAKFRLIKTRITLTGEKPETKPPPPYSP